MLTPMKTHEIINVREFNKSDIIRFLTAKDNYSGRRGKLDMNILEMKSPQEGLWKSLTTARKNAAIVQ
jgi:hypothetical protein